MKFIVDATKFKEMADNISASSIVEKRSVSKLIRFNNQNYMICSGVSGNNGCSKLWGYQVTELSLYKGSLTPLPYAQHFEEVSLKLRDRSYNGMLLTCGGVKLVVDGLKTEFAKSEAGQQVSLF